MIALNSKQIRQLDTLAIEKMKIPGLLLMENAAHAFVEEFMKHPEQLDQVYIFCGLGNNGGDGFAIARLLSRLGVNVQVFIVGDSTKISGDAKVNYEIILRLGLKVEEIQSQEQLEALFMSIPNDAVLIDALLGTGLNKNIEGLLKETIHYMNDSDLKIYSVDIPSGINADNGRIMGVCVNAYKTITFCLPKIGLFLYPGALMTGDVIVVDIGIPKCLWENEDYKYELLEPSLLRYLPKRHKQSHKGTYGKVLIIAGSKHMMGAAALSAYAALKAGCGLVKVMTEEGNHESIYSFVPEATLMTYSKEEPEKTLQLLKEGLEWADAVLIGPGMGQDEMTLKIVEMVLKQEDLRVVLDADALNVLSKHIELLENCSYTPIITPHLGEMSRLTGYDTNAIHAATVEFADAFSQKYSVVTVLKSERTIIANEERIYVNILGNDGMATAGSGDVLSGIITSLFSQTNNAELSAILGVIIHSMAGDLAKKELGTYSMTARDILFKMSAVLKEYSQE